MRKKWVGIEICGWRISAPQDFKLEYNNTLFIVFGVWNSVADALVRRKISIRRKLSNTLGKPNNKIRHTEANIRDKLRKSIKN